MAALVFCVCGALHDLYDFTDAFKRCDCDYQRTINYLNYKKRILLFRQYCREFNVNYKKSLKIRADVVASETEVIPAFVIKRSAKFFKEIEDTDEEDQVDNIAFVKPKVIMSKRSGVDFAAIEASAEAFEVIDSFGVKQSTSSEDFIEIERQYSGFRENYEFDEEDIEVIEGVEEVTIYQDEYDDPIYQNPLLGKLQEGVSYTVNGKTMRHCERFSINFLVENSSRDIALHINPRLPQNYIVRNSKVRNAWGHEEVASALPFSLRRGARFSIQVLFTEENYMISVNGQHFCKFYHRLPYKSVQTLEVKGEIEDVSVERKMVEYYPERFANSEPEKVRIEKALTTMCDTDTTDYSDDEESMSVLPSGVAPHWRINESTSVIENNETIIERLRELKLPYYGAIPTSFFQLGRVLRVEGRVRLLPQSFYINMQTGYNSWPHPVVALHLNPRFTKQRSGNIGRATVIRNSWVNGRWGQEERSEMETAFRPGQQFSLSILHASDSFEIYVNHELLTEYKFRVSPSTIDTIYIQGDIKLFNVDLLDEASFERLKQAKPRRWSLKL